MQIFMLNQSTYISFHFFFVGELDPERMGSGIQYGNTQLRKTGPPKPETEKCDC